MRSGSSFLFVHHLSALGFISFPSFSVFWNKLSSSAVTDFKCLVGLSSENTEPLVADDIYTPF